MELGSEFSLNLRDLKITGNSFFRYIGEMKYCLFDSGRSALKAISRTLGNGSVLMPEYICGSVLNCFPEEKLAFYRLKDNLRIDANDLMSKINGNTAAVYLMHYFGSLQPADVLTALQAEKEKHGFVIIEDTTHSLFSKKRTVGDYCVASLRKWFAVPNGGVLYSRGSLDAYDGMWKRADDAKAYAMMLKTLCLDGRLDCNSVYRRIFNECEKKLDGQKEIGKISDFSNFLLGCYNVNDLVEKRRSNLACLKNELSGMGLKQICDFSEKDCPFAFPVTVPDRDDFRRYLTENRIYCAVHWPFYGPAHSERPLASVLSDHMLSLPIDQRYGEKEMTCMAQVINKYKGRLTC